MALRAIVNKKEDVLHKKCRVVEKFDEKLASLIDDMKETLIASQGVGLAAPQVGFLKRVFVIDNNGKIIEAVNPQISKKLGKQRDPEGCLSCPGEFGYVTRARHCTLKAQDRNGKWFEVSLSNLSARCAQHEYDHLEGKLFLELVDEWVQVQE